MEVWHFLLFDKCSLRPGFLLLIRRSDDVSVVVAVRLGQLQHRALCIPWVLVQAKNGDEQGALYGHKLLSLHTT